MATKKIFDRNILIVIGFLVVVALTVVLFRTFTKPKCPDAKFSVVNQEIKAGDEVFFKDETEGSVKWDWDFGDSSSHADIANPSHVYGVPGEYTIWLHVNGCQDGFFAKISVGSRELPSIDTILPIGGISGPAKATVGQIVTFKDTSNAASTWEWQFGETGHTDATEREAKYVFQQPGEHTVTLVINGKSQTATHKIFIQPKKAPSGPKTPSISEAQFIELLNKIIAREEKGASIFTPYTCGYNNQPIKVNGTEKIFDSYCTGLRLSGANKVIQSVKLSRDKDGCINGIEITETTK